MLIASREEAPSGSIADALGKNTAHQMRIERASVDYQHLLVAPIASIARDDPQRALALLCQPVDSLGDMVEQLASRQELVTNRGLMELATVMPKEFSRFLT